MEPAGGDSGAGIHLKIIQKRQKRPMSSLLHLGPSYTHIEKLKSALPSWFLCGASVGIRVTQALPGGPK